MHLSVVIPTHNRREVLAVALARLEDHAGDDRFEVIVVDDGSEDGTAEAVEERALRSPIPITVLSQPASGPAAARNRGLAAAQAPICLSLDDDTWPRPGLVRRHLDFHRARPEPEAALLGHVTVAERPPPTPFMRWLASLHLGYDQIADPDDAGGGHFYSGNVSAKTELLRDAGGFDESFSAVAYDDIDLGLRLEQRGMRLAYDAEAVVEHYQPTDLSRTVARMLEAGRALVRFAENHPDRAVARRPGMRHRVKAAALTGLAAAGVRNPRVQHETWRFLCHEAMREGYWTAVDGGDRRRAAHELRIGRTLARLASRDPDARMPRHALPGDHERQAVSA
jgi:glycosyltransferase involved in cell wall biosynthesis